MSRYLFRLAAPLCAALLLLACTPTYDWREVHGSNIPFTVVLPAKPATYTRPVNLDGTQVNMTMTAAEADGVIFAVATAEMADAARAQTALEQMKTAMVRNIQGTVRKEKAVAMGDSNAIEVEAASAQRAMHARFVARGTRIYQVMAMGQPDRLKPEAVETFLTSFKPE
ncbi:hypothetical protein E4K72_00890 [Oxalobacteraceae bacterium OM1]|nr:hypothetical protein E4K72_00890 [Oxalobacteraceae bacterium OM1]